MGALIAGAIMWRIRPTPDTPAVTRFAVTIPDDQQLQENGRIVLAISPDGSKFVYAANGRLYLRSLSGLQATPIAGTETPQFFSNNPVFSPDGEWIAFVSVARRTSERSARLAGRQSPCVRDAVLWDAWTGRRRASSSARPATTPAPGICRYTSESARLGGHARFAGWRRAAGALRRAGIRSVGAADAA